MLSVACASPTASIPPGWRRRGPTPEAATVTRFPSGSSGTSTTSFRTGRSGKPHTSTLEAGIERYAALKGTLAQGPDRLLEAFRLSEELGQLAYRVWYFPSLRYDEDQRDNAVNARRQQVQILFARWKQAESWFNPELLADSARDRARLDGRESRSCALYRFAIEDLYRQQEHVLDEAGERLMSLSSRLASAPNDAYWALSTADAKFPTITLSTGEEVDRLVRAVPRDPRDAPRAGGPRAAFAALHDDLQVVSSTPTRRSTTASASATGSRRAPAATRARSRRRCTATTSRPSVVENLIETTRAGVEPLRRYHRLRRRTLGVPTYQVYDFAIPLVTFDKKYQYDEVLDWIVESVAPLGPEYQARMREGFAGRWIDVYENEGKRSGAYSAPVYGTHPYMLLNYTDTLDDVFTLAHEMGHSMHTILSHETQPFIYSSYTIFVAEVPSTLSEALLLDYMLEHSTDPDRADRPAAARDRQHHRHVLHAGDVRRLRAARAPPGRTGPADHRARS